MRLDRYVRVTACVVSYNRKDMVEACLAALAVQDLPLGGGLGVDIASTAGMAGRPGWLTYSSSKAALIAMTEVMRE
jgi:NAD(P)-dependent dehydrogenase (short-subunit alcohol dehydrogenase family)